MPNNTNATPTPQFTDWVKVSPRISVRPDMAERIDIGKKRPTKEQFKGKKGYRENSDGSWRYKFKPNEQGKMTREAAEVFDMMKPFARADSERHQRLSAKMPRERLRDESGSVQYVDAERAEATAKQNGWHSATRLAGVLARSVSGEFCAGCDRLRVWCDCKGDA